jgi:light-regulated signal transduction histidine kinase (bacteriophytochrome)
MGMLIDDLLKFSRLSRTELASAPVEMTALVRSVIDDLSRTREGLPPIQVAPLPPVTGDLNLLRQVWTNLIDNGIKYSGKAAQPQVEIGARANGREVTYWVKDNGVGFDMKYAGKLFGVFQRLHTQDEFEGTGVGLAIVQRVVHRHGGRVWAEAAPGQGATFSFSLPVGGLNGGG